MSSVFREPGDGWHPTPAAAICAALGGSQKSAGERVGEGRQAWNKYVAGRQAAGADKVQGWAEQLGARLEVGPLGWRVRMDDLIERWQRDATERAGPPYVQIKGPFPPPPGLVEPLGAAEAIRECARLMGVPE